MCYVPRTLHQNRSIRVFHQSNDSLGRIDWRPNVEHLLLCIVSSGNLVLSNKDYVPWSQISSKFPSMLLLLTTAWAGMRWRNKSSWVDDGWTMSNSTFSGSCPIRMRRLATSSSLSYKCRLQIVFSRVASPNSEHVARHWRPIESSLVGGSPSQYVLRLLALAVVCRWLYGCCPTQ
jgi:hypothetical protein